MVSRSELFSVFMEAYFLWYPCSCNTNRESLWPLAQRTAMTSHCVICARMGNVPYLLHCLVLF